MQGYMTYVKFEERRGEWGKARRVLEEFLARSPTLAAYLKVASWEQHTMKDAAAARSIFERALTELSEKDAKSSELLLRFAKFEEGQGEVDCARAVLKFGAKYAKEAEQALVEFERRHGDTKALESQVLERRRKVYEDAIEKNPRDYDAWFQLAKLYETTSSSAAEEDVLSTYRRATRNRPIDGRKKNEWRRYVYLWIRWAVYAEVEAKSTSVEDVRAIYRAALEAIPHEHFTFGKLWLLSAKFEIRQKKPFRREETLGEALGRCPKRKLFRSYIEIEKGMGNVERCRKIFAKWIEWSPVDVEAWCSFADLESKVGEEERCRAIFELAVESAETQQAPILWGAYIQFEIEGGEKVTHGRCTIAWSILSRRKWTVEGGREHGLHLQSLRLKWAVVSTAPVEFTRERAMSCKKYAARVTRAKCARRERSYSMPGRSSRIL